MKKVCGIMALLAVAGLAAKGARADTVYDTTEQTTGYIDQQTGNNFYSLGEQVTVASPGQVLQSIAIDFGSSYYNGSSNGSPFTYTPDITLSIYDSAADANLQGSTGLIGAAVVSNVQFSNDGVVDPVFRYNFEDEQLLTFDFGSQNIVLPSTFVFAYHDSPPAGSNVDGANGLSVGLTAQAATTGTSYQSTFDSYPNGSPSVLDYSWDAGLNIEARITTVATPLPSAAGMGLGLFGLIGAGKLLRRKPRVA